MVYFNCILYDISVVLSKNVFTNSSYYELININKFFSFDCYFTSYETLNNLCQKVLFRFFFTPFFFYELHIYNPIMYCIVSRPIFMDLELRQNIYFKFSHNPCIHHSINNCTIPSLPSSSLRPSSLSELNLERSERDCF